MSTVSLPPCWSNDERMNVLFQPFRERNLNTAAWDGKMKFWKELISSTFNSEPMLFVSSEDELANLFSRKAKKPVCLNLVIQSLCNEDKTLMLRSKYETEMNSLIARNSAVSWTGWGYQTFVRRPFTWAMDQTVGKLAKKDIGPDDQLVYPSNISKQSHTLLSRVCKDARDCTSSDQHFATELLVPLSKVEQTSSSYNICSAKHLPLLLLNLESNKSIIRITNEHGEFIKFAQNDKPVEPVTEVEFGILKLKQGKNSMEKQVETLQETVNNLTSTIKRELAMGNKQRALRALRSKKNKEKTLKARLDYLDRLDDTLDQIHSASTDQLVLDAYRHGSIALKARNVAMPANDVYATMDELGETLNTSQQISEALSTSIVDESGTDDLEEELADLLSGAENLPSPQKTENRSSGLTTNEGIDDILLSLGELDVSTELPSVPQHEPGISSKVKLKAQ